MPPRDWKKTKARSNRVYTYLTDSELEDFKALCAAHGETEAEMMRVLIGAAHARTQPPKPKPERTRLLEETLHVLNASLIQLKRVGINLNQIAKQINTGLVPVSQAELAAVFADVREAADRVHAAGDKLLS